LSGWPYGFNASTVAVNTNAVSNSLPKIISPRQFLRASPVFWEFDYKRVRQANPLPLRPRFQNLFEDDDEDENEEDN
jgi:hypothetical protein